MNTFKFYMHIQFAYNYMKIEIQILINTNSNIKPHKSTSNCLKFVTESVF